MPASLSAISRAALIQSASYLRCPFRKFDALRSSSEYAAFKKMIMAQGLGDAGQALRNEKGNRCPGTPGPCRKSLACPKSSHEIGQHGGVGTMMAAVYAALLIAFLLDLSGLRRLAVTCLFRLPCPVRLAIPVGNLQPGLRLPHALAASRGHPQLCSAT